jgi:hypothetical protein
MTPPRWDPPRHRKAGWIGSRGLDSSASLGSRIARSIAPALPPSPRRGPPSSCASRGADLAAVAPRDHAAASRRRAGCCLDEFQRIEPSAAERICNSATNAAFFVAIGVGSTLSTCAARSPQLSLSTQRSTQTSSPPCSLAARPQQYRAPQPSQCVRASLCVLKARGNRAQ